MRIELHIASATATFNLLFPFMLSLSGCIAQKRSLQNLSNLIVNSESFSLAPKGSRVHTWLRHCFMVDSLTLGISLEVRQYNLKKEDALLKAL